MVAIIIPIAAPVNIHKDYYNHKVGFDDTSGCS